MAHRRQHRTRQGARIRRPAIIGSMLLGLALSAGLAGPSEASGPYIRPPVAAPDRTPAPAETPPAQMLPAPLPPAAEAVPAPSLPPAPPAPQLSGVAADIKGRWISSLDAAFTGAPTSEKQQMLLDRCANSYAIFEVKASQLIEDFRQGSNAWRSEYAIAAQDSDSLAVRGAGAAGHAVVADVSLSREQGLTAFGFPADVLVFDIRAPQQDGTRYSARKYARCPAQP